eukprot:9700987-Alexandrium_andersonii.AAC.1
MGGPSTPPLLGCKPLTRRHGRGRAACCARPPFLACSWEGPPSPGPEVAATRLLKGCHLDAGLAEEDFLPADGAWL